VVARVNLQQRFLIRFNIPVLYQTH
jgi:hypothetical protein